MSGPYPGLHNHTPESRPHVFRPCLPPPFLLQALLQLLPQITGFTRWLIDTKGAKASGDRTPPLFLCFIYRAVERECARLSVLKTHLLKEAASPLFTHLTRGDLLGNRASDIRAENVELGCRGRGRELGTHLTLAQGLDNRCTKLIGGV